MSEENPKLEIGQEGMLKVCEILGLEEFPVQRVIIDFQVDGVVQIFTKQCIEVEKFDELLELLGRFKTKTKKTPKKDPDLKTMQTPEQEPLKVPGCRDWE